MAIVLRFVDGLFQIREEFLGFVACQKGMSGEVLAKEITGFIQSIGLRMDDCRGQGYDGQEIWLGNILGLQRESREFMRRLLMFTVTRMF